MIDDDGNIVKSVFESMELDEISGVDTPAQPTARVSIMKRAAGIGKDKDAEENALEAEDEGADKKGKKKNPFTSSTKRALLTTATNGHQHLLTDEVGADTRASAGETGVAQDNEGNYHSHPWAIDGGSGAVVIGEVSGHNHQVLLT